MLPQDGQCMLTSPILKRVYEIVFVNGLGKYISHLVLWRYIYSLHTRFLNFLS